MNTESQNQQKPIILNINAIHKVDSYPYGGKLRCKASFSIEFDKKKGFRSIFQTVNPKNGRINAPKKSTYGHLLYNYINPDDGHIKVGHKSLSGYEEINKTLDFIDDNKAELQLTKEMLESIGLTALASIKANMAYTRVSDPKRLFTILERPIRLLVRFVKGEDVNIKDIKIDIEAINEIRN